MLTVVESIVFLILFKGNLSSGLNYGQHEIDSNFPLHLFGLPPRRYTTLFYLQIANVVQIGQHLLTYKICSILLGTFFHGSPIGTE